MHIVITDSGVGGLSVCAFAERFVRVHGFSEPVKLTFANAAPANDYGYNSMPSREAKLETFDRFLRSVTEKFAPDSIYVACNTLSVLLPDTPFFHRAPIPVKGIVETGAELLVRELALNPRSVAVIFGTQTTIDAGAYPQILRERGVDSSRIVSQACPGLADTISEDREGARTKAGISQWVTTALAKKQAAEAPVVAYLACTHYGYRRDLFAEAFDALGVRAKVVNPNERAVDDIFGARSEGAVHDVDVRFVTRYAIPQTAIEALTWFLGGISPKTVAAMQHFVHLPDLF
jgi:glutamate racemase